MSAALGLRERKKRQTRQLIFDTAQRLFVDRGFEQVTVAEVARAADVSEVTVFNYFPTKEDLFFGGMTIYEDYLLETVAGRRPGESAARAFRRALLESAEAFGNRQRTEAALRGARIISASPSLLARERGIVDRYTERLAELLARESGADPDDVEARAVASALMGTHRVLVAYVRKRMLAGRRGARLAADLKTQTMRAFARLERGLGDYAVKK